jgi:D-xylose transport system substrate-binding protein
MRKLIFNILMISLVAFSGCGNKDKIKVGLSLGPNHERWMKDRDFLIQYLKSYDAEVFVKEANNQERLQATHAQELIDKNKVNVLIIIPVNSESSGRIVDYAKQKGVRVIAYDRIIKNCDLDFYISFDNVRVGEIQAEYLTRIKPEGKYAILGGDASDNNTTLLRLGQMNILQPYIIKGDIQIVFNENIMNWDSNIAYQKINDYLKTGNGLDAIVSSSDVLSEGAARALNEHGLNNVVLLSGQDAETEACRRIVQNKQTMTVYKVIESLAYSTANIAMTLANADEVPNSQITLSNGKKMVPSILLSSVMPVTKENLRMTVIADGYLDENAVFRTN